MCFVEVQTALGATQPALTLNYRDTDDNDQNPIRDGNEKDDEHFQGKVFITARSNDKPQVVDMDAEPVMDQDDFYSGCLARADVYIFAYDKAGNKGVSMILNSVQKLGDGERLSGRRSAASAFAEED